MRLEVYKKDLEIIDAFAKSLDCPTPLFSASLPYYARAIAEGRGKARYGCDRNRAARKRRTGAGVSDGRSILRPESSWRARLRQLAVSDCLRLHADLRFDAHHQFGADRILFDRCVCRLDAPHAPLQFLGVGSGRRNHDRALGLCALQSLSASLSCRSSHVAALDARLYADARRFGARDLGRRPAFDLAAARALDVAAFRTPRVSVVLAGADLRESAQLRRCSSSSCNARNSG